MNVCDECSSESDVSVEESVYGYKSVEIVEKAESSDEVSDDDDE